MSDNQLLVLVAGDLLADHHLYDGVRRPPAAPPVTTRLSCVSGGAGLLAGILRTLSTQDASFPSASRRLTWRAELLPEDSIQHLAAMNAKSFAVWRIQPKKPGDDKTFVWRLSEPLGYGDSGPSAPTNLNAKLVDSQPEIVVLDDAGRGFRLQSHESAWPAVLKETQSNDGRGASPARPAWVVVKMSAPLAQGDLWRTLRATMSDRLIVVASIDDLRKEEVLVTKGISWERTAENIAFELTCNPSIRDLLNCRHLVISLGLEGALHYSRLGAHSSQIQLLYDPQYLEGESGGGLEGTAVGFQSCLASAIARECAFLVGAARDERAQTEEGAGQAHEQPRESDSWRLEKEAVQNGIRAGLCAMRLLRDLGHGDTKNAEPGFPFFEISTAIRGAAHAAPVRFEVAEVPAADAACLTQDSAWSIVTASQQRLNLSRIPLYGLAARVARNGLSQFGGVPYLRFEKLFTVDRNEIESLRSLQRLIVDYLRSDKEDKPLSMAVFGPPGAGKSFAVKQLAHAIYKREFRKEAPILEFNLSQFTTADELVGAFHAIRDEVLKGVTPVIFWDEFDSGEYRWLQSLLAPMQDGKFNEGQVTHPIGKCVFVFAGGTSFDFDNFGPPEWDEEKFTEFRMKKGTDFKSRLSGYLNVLGPNPRLQLRPVKALSGVALKSEWVDDPNDIGFPIRRALLIRSALGLKDDERLEMDGGVLSSLLELRHYRHGARSLEKIVLQMKVHRDGQAIRRSALPPRELVAMHADYGELCRIANRDLQFRTLGEQMAPKIHDCWRINKRHSLQEKAKPGETVKFKWDCDFGQLPVWLREDNIAAAARIPRILAMVGLRVVPEDDPATASSDEVNRIISEHEQFLAEEEHDGWVEQRIRNNWKFGKPRDDDRRIHDMLIPYRDLTEEVKRYDIAAIRHIPETVKAAGFKVVHVGSDSQPGVGSI